MCSSSWQAVFCYWLPAAYTIPKDELFRSSKTVGFVFHIKAVTDRTRIVYPTRTRWDFNSTFKLTSDE